MHCKFEAIASCDHLGSSLHKQTAHAETSSTISAEISHDKPVVLRGIEPTTQQLFGFFFAHLRETSSFLLPGGSGTSQRHNNLFKSAIAKFSMRSALDRARHCHELVLVAHAKATSRITGRNCEPVSSGYSAETALPVEGGSVK